MGRLSTSLSGAIIASRTSVLFFPFADDKKEIFIQKCSFPIPILCFRHHCAAIIAGSTNERDLYSEVFLLNFHPLFSPLPPPSLVLLTKEIFIQNCSLSIPTHCFGHRHRKHFHHQRMVLSPYCWIVEFNNSGTNHTQ